jgi:hypothetical protein
MTLAGNSSLFPEGEFFFLCDAIKQKMPRRRRSRVGGDPYNSGELRAALAGYQKVSIPEVCGDPISRDNLTVWVNQTGKWSQFDTSKLWLKRGPSLCRELVTELGMSSAQYESLRDAFNDAKSTDLVGLYRKGDEYAIVLRVPKTSVLDKLAIGGAAGGGAIAGALTTWAARRYWGNAGEIDERISAFNHYIADMIKLLQSEEFKLRNINTDLVQEYWDDIHKVVLAASEDIALDSVFDMVELPYIAFAIFATGEDKNLRSVYRRQVCVTNDSEKCLRLNAAFDAISPNIAIHQDLKELASKILENHDTIMGM